MAASNNNLDLAKLLVSHGALIEGPHHHNDSGYHCGQTPLMSACYQGNLDIVKFLLDNGANANSADSEGKTALDYCLLGISVNETSKDCRDLMQELGVKSKLSPELMDLPN